MHHRALSFNCSPLANTDLSPFSTGPYALEEGGLVSPTSQLLISPKVNNKAHVLFSSRHHSQSQAQIIEAPPFAREKRTIKKEQVKVIKPRPQNVSSRKVSEELEHEFRSVGSRQRTKQREERPEIADKSERLYKGEKLRKRQQSEQAFHSV